jgi:TonB family protein
MQDYLSGKLSDAEMHEVEKHMLTCAFCEEAMEGLETREDVSTFETDVSKLKERIEQKVQKSGEEKIIVPLYKKALRIAAMLAVLIVASVLVTNYFKADVKQKEFSEKKKTELPKEKKGSNKEVEKQKEIAIDSTIKPAEKRAPKTEEIPRNNQEITKQEPIKEQPEMEEEISLTNNDKQAKSVEPVVVNEMIVMDEDAFLEEEILSVEAEVAEEDLISVESMEFEEGMVMGLEADDAAIPASKSERSMYNAAGADAKAVQKKTASKKEIIQPHPFDEDTYQQYLIDSLRYPKKAAKAKIKGTVTLQFIVGKNGEISQVKVIKSIGYGCDKEAIRLLKEGPTWTPGSEDGKPVEMETEVKVKFK